MDKLSFIYANRFKKARAFSFITFIITISMLCYLLTKSKDNLAASIIAVILIGAMGFYFCYFFQHQTLSFTLSQTHIQHHCAKGGWSIPWNKISAIGLPSVNHKGWHRTLPWVALKLKNYESILNSISFRVANQILIDQRALLLTGYRYAKHPSVPLEEMLFDDTPYIAQSGKIYRGLLAMLANRMTYTRELMGFDVFIEPSLLDRPLEDFVGITRSYLASA